MGHACCYLSYLHPQGAEEGAKTTNSQAHYNSTGIPKAAQMKNGFVQEAGEGNPYPQPWKKPEELNLPPFGCKEHKAWLARAVPPPGSNPGGRRSWIIAVRPGKLDILNADCCNQK
ncbi:unnamed protein product [Eretmochelys imbricata]